MANLFNSVKMTRPKNSRFDLSHDIKLSANMGNLVPIMCMETVPGDKFQISSEAMVRFAPLVSPVMHRMNITMHYFFVPNRILWPNWEKFITNTKVADALPAFPYLNYGWGSQSELMDYMGLPTPPEGADNEKISALPFAAYQMIYNEYYRDQNLQAEVPFQLVDGDNSTNDPLYWLRKRAWEHDYFTSALPFAQKGDAVSLPLGQLSDVGVFTNLDPTAGTVLDGTVDIAVPAGSAPSVPSELYAATSQAQTEATTINDLRRAFRLQEWLEKNARGGTRYIENILAHFGVKSSDKRLQRPEYITGTKSPVIISEVLNTTGTTELPQGNMAGHAIGVSGGKSGRYYCEEHGYIIGIMSVMPATAYQQGIPKHFLKTEDPFQYYWPSFANIGEQEVLNKEVFAFQNEAGADVFGYVPRYAEYKFEQNRVAGEFRGTLNHWHLGRIFSAPPALNENFIESNPTHRVFAVTDEEEQKLYCHVYNKIAAIRPMPKYGTPQF